MSAPAKLQVNWEAHLEALPLATWIVRFDAEPSLSQNQYIQVRDPCGPVFANRACREVLGLATVPDDQGAWSRYLHPEDRQASLMAWTEAVTLTLATLLSRRRSSC